MTTGTTAPAGPAAPGPGTAPGRDEAGRDEAGRDEAGLRDLLVRQVRLEADAVVSLALADPAGAPLPPWAPGAHVDLVLPSGRVRQFSLCGPPEDDRTYTVAVLREPESRGGSAEVHETALVGRRLAVRGPRNHFPLVDAPAYLFLAGGIGITPIVAMLEETRRRGRPYRLVYGGRRRASMAFADLLEARHGANATLLPEDQAGRIDLEALLSSAAPGTAVYCCGPPAMLAAAEEAAARLLAPGALHLERFTAPAPAGPGSGQEAGAPDGAGGDGAFEVELARTGVVLTVPPDRSLLRVVLEAVPSHLYSCEEGYCGTCETVVLDGEPDHRDTVLTDEERAEHKMMICVGRSRSNRLVLDL